MRKIDVEPRKLVSPAMNIVLGGAALYLAHRNRESKSRESQLRYVATHDRLTGLLNDHGLEEMLKKTTPPQAVLYVDGTNQKAVNDKLGHNRGDGAIVGMAGVLLNSLRQGDEVARIGGDEFLVWLRAQQRGPHQYTLAERLEVVTARIGDETQSFLDENPDLRDVGFNIAVGSAISQQGMTIEDLRQNAESDMYVHKDEQHQANGQHRPQS